MNWSKIKTILIMILVFTNILLLKTYLDNLSGESNADYDDIVKLYAAKGVGISLSEREFPEVLGGIAAELSAVPESAEAQIFEYFDDTDMVFNHTATDMSISSVWIDVPAFEPSLVNISGDLADMYKNRADEFLQEMGFEINMRRFLFYELGEVLMMEAYQAVEQGGFVVPLAEGSVRLYFDRSDGDKIVGITINKYLKINEGQSNSYAIISADEALFSALEKAPVGDELVGLSLVYKLNDESLLVTNLVRGEMLPYYELMFKRAGAVYVRASR